MCIYLCCEATSVRAAVKSAKAAYQESGLHTCLQHDAASICAYCTALCF